MILFIDSVVWIGAKLKRDQWHRKSVPIIKKFLFLMFSVVANGSSLAYVKKRGHISLNFASLSPLQPCVRSEERERRDDAKAKDWKPQNPSE